MQFPLFDNLDRVSNLEITDFYVPDHETDRCSFEYAYKNFKQYDRLTVLLSFSPLIDGPTRTTSVHKHYGPPINSARLSPATVRVAGWDSKDDQSDDGSQIAKFTSIWSWQKGQAGRQAWYGEFSERARSEYDRLGHIIDWIRILSRRVDCLFLVFVRWDQVIGTLNMEYRSQRQPPLPRFGVPL